MAVAVHVEGERIGYLPGYLAHLQRLAADEGRHEHEVEVASEALADGERELWSSTPALSMASTTSNWSNR